MTIARIVHVFMSLFVDVTRHAVQSIVVAVAEGHGFDSLWGNLTFSLT